MPAGTQLLLVPWDSGHRGIRMGAGPDHLLRHGAASRLRGGGEVGAAYVESESDFPTEAGTTFELQRKVALRVAETVRGGQRPVVLSGNCGIALGTIAGLAAAGRARVGVVWFDAHGEFNTPETTTSGYLDGMGLAALTGLAWRSMAAQVPGHAALPVERLLLVGTRDLDVPESEAIARLRVPVLDAVLLQREPSALARMLDALAAHADEVYVHVDPDVLDPVEARGNLFAPAGGLAPAELLAALRTVRERFPVAAVGIGSFEPGADHNANVLRTLLEALQVLGA